MSSGRLKAQLERLKEVIREIENTECSEEFPEVRALIDERNALDPDDAETEEERTAIVIRQAELGIQLGKLYLKKARKLRGQQ